MPYKMIIYLGAALSLWVVLSTALTLVLRKDGSLILVDGYMWAMVVCLINHINGLSCFMPLHWKSFAIN